VLTQCHNRVPKKEKKKTSNGYEVFISTEIKKEGIKLKNGIFRGY
jgi:hypothetical protein